MTAGPSRSMIPQNGSDQPAAAEYHAEQQADADVDRDGGVVRFARLAVVAGAAVIAADVREECGADKSAPPGEADARGIAAIVALGAVGIRASTAAISPAPASSFVLLVVVLRFFVDFLHSFPFPPRSIVILVVLDRLQHGAVFVFLGGASLGRRRRGLLSPRPRLTARRRR